MPFFLLVIFYYIVIDLFVCFSFSAVELFYGPHAWRFSQHTFTPYTSKPCKNKHRPHGILLSWHTPYSQSGAQASLIHVTQRSTCHFKWPTKDLPWWHKHQLCPRSSWKCPSAYETSVFRAAPTTHEDYWSRKTTGSITRTKVNLNLSCLKSITKLEMHTYTLYVHILVTVFVLSL